MHNATEVADGGSSDRWNPATQRENTSCPERQKSLGRVEQRSPDPALGRNAEARTLSMGPFPRRREGGLEPDPAGIEVSSIFDLDELMAAITPTHQEVGRVTPAIPGMLEPDRCRLRSDRCARVEKARQRHEVPLQRALMFRYPG